MSARPSLGWLDLSSGVSGDMLLGALVDAGVAVGDLQSAVDAVTPQPMVLRVEAVSRGTIAATRVVVEGSDSATHRRWSDVRDLLNTPAAQQVPGVDRAVATFTVLAEAEAAVHGTESEDVHFHEVGALDAIADVVGVCAGFALLGLDELHASPVALGGGTVEAAHGRIAVPGPAVVRLLAGVPTYGGPVDLELATPTGAALLRTLVTAWGYQPLMSVERQAFGAGGRDPQGHANALRLVLGSPWTKSDPEPDLPVVLETNVDDLDPRLWPSVITALLAAGASDAWLTPILMKKGRPAHTLHVLVGADRSEAVREIVFSQTTAIGLREHPVRKQALDRATVTVHVSGHPVRVKVASWEGRVLNRQPEWDDVAAAAAALGRPAKVVLSQAVAAAAVEGDAPQTSPGEAAG